MDESLFYIAGGALIVVALIVSFIGLRSDKFPSGNALTVGTVVVFLLVAATAVGAVELAKHEEGKRLDEANAEADVSQAQQTETNQQAGSAPADTPGEKPTGGSGSGDSALVAEGKQVFVSTGCGSCHTVAELGPDAQGTIGPNLDTELAGKDEQFIKTSIVDPSAFVAKGYPDGTMPSNYGDQLSSRQINALTAFLSQTAGN
jgi:mono/diheme cytochrome c family protein